MAHPDLTPLIPYALSFAGATIPILGAFIRADFKRYVDTHVTNTRLRSLLDRVERFAEIEVANLEATVVPEAKRDLADGKMTAEERNRIKQLAIARLKQDIGEDACMSIDALIGGRDLGEFLGAIIEKYVLKLPPSAAPAQSAPAPAPDAKEAA